MQVDENRVASHPTLRQRVHGNGIRAAVGVVLVGGTAVGGFLIAGVSSGSTVGNQGTSAEDATPPAAGSGLDGPGGPGGSGGPSGPGGPGGPGGAKPTTVGTVKTVDAASDSFVLTESGTSVTVDVSSSTTYFDPSVSSPSLANVSAGEQVAVIGTTATGTVTAGKVLIGTPGGHGGPGGPGGAKPTTVGTVKTVDAASDSFVLTEKSGTSVTVDVTSSTTYFDPSVSSPSLANVSAGEQVAVIGTTATGTVTAGKVLIGTPGGHGGPGGPGRPGGPGGGVRGIAAPVGG